MAPGNEIVANFARYKGRLVRLSSEGVDITVEVEGNENTPWDEIAKRGKAALLKGFETTEFDDDLGLYVLAYPFPLVGGGGISCSETSREGVCAYTVSATFDLLARIESIRTGINKLGMTVQMPVLSVVVAWDGAKAHVAPEIEKALGRNSK